MSGATRCKGLFTGSEWRSILFALKPVQSGEALRLTLTELNSMGSPSLRRCIWNSAGLMPI
ncbi:hypothetical protein DLM45_04250 [Hyphomicrobium methylovorum]|nr:hypothetical protein [Hyphomicrobium methylovorum]